MFSVTEFGRIVFEGSLSDATRFVLDKVGLLGRACKAGILIVPSHLMRQAG